LGSAGSAGKRRGRDRSVLAAHDIGEQLEVGLRPALGPRLVAVQPVGDEFGDHVVRVAAVERHLVQRLHRRDAGPAPAVKKAMMNSSTDRVKATRAPARIPGKMIGKVTRRNV